MNDNGSKPFWASKTVLFNVLAIMVLVANSYGFGDFQLPEGSDRAVEFAIVIINLALRFMTKTSVTVKPTGGGTKID